VSVEKNKKEYGFRKDTKELAVKIANYKCECCGKKLNKKNAEKAEIHHLLPIMEIYDCCPEMSTHLINQLANAVVLCHDCHCLLHQKEENIRPFYQKLIKELQFLEELSSRIYLRRGAKEAPFKKKRKAILNYLRSEI
jgi:predicted HNH restriction endonuclease